jgi:hypothetical protein
MADLSGFDALAPENQNSRCLPKGEYRCVMVASERKATNDGTGHYLNCEFSILDGEYQNQKIFCNLNVWLHPSKEKAIKIAKGQLSELCRSVGVLTPKDTSELHGKPLIVRLVIKTSDEYGDQNAVVGFKACQLHQVAAPPPPPVAQTESKQAVGGVW